MHESLDFSRRAVILTGGAWVLALAFVPPFAPHASAQTRAGGKRPIGIIGAGNIGGTIGGLWIKAGHPVMFSSRNPGELADMVRKLGPLAHAGTVAEAIAFGDALLIAVPYAALPQIGSDYAAALKGKVVLDACNATPARDGAALAREADENGIGATSQKYLAGTRLVRAFNTLSFKTFADEANRPDPKLAIPIAGDDAGAVRMAEELVRDAGFEPVLAGPLAEARKFQQRGGAGYGVAGSARELREKLGLAP